MRPEGFPRVAQQQRRRAPLPSLEGVAPIPVAARGWWTVELQDEPLFPPDRDSQDLCEALAESQRLQGVVALAEAYQRGLGEASL